jgi:hypothetical protein
MTPGEAFIVFMFVRTANGRSETMRHYHGSALARQSNSGPNGNEYGHVAEMPAFYFTVYLYSSCGKVSFHSTLYRKKGGMP